jgi:hypothetical protein
MFRHEVKEVKLPPSWVVGQFEIRRGSQAVRPVGNYPRANTQSLHSEADLQSQARCGQSLQLTIQVSSARARSSAMENPEAIRKAQAQA